MFAFFGSYKCSQNYLDIIIEGENTGFGGCEKLLLRLKNHGLSTVYTILYFYVQRYRAKW